MSKRKTPAPILVHEEIVPGLRRRTQGGRELNPIWTGERASDAIDVARRLNLRSVTACATGETYIEFGGRWYALPWREAA